MKSTGTRTKPQTVARRKNKGQSDAGSSTSGPARTTGVGTRRTGCFDKKNVTANQTRRRTAVACTGLLHQARARLHFRFSSRASSSPPTVALPSTTPARTVPEQVHVCQTRRFNGNLNTVPDRVVRVGGAHGAVAVAVARTHRAAASSSRDFAAVYAIVGRPGQR